MANERTALPTWQDRSAELAVVYWNGTTATGTLLGQVQNFSWTSEKETRDTYRVGDSTRHTAYTAINSDFTLNLYEDDDAQEIFLVWGGDVLNTATGWSSSVDVQLLTTDTGVTVTIANYAAESVGSNLLWTETLAVANVISVERNLEANAENVWTFTGRADSIIGEPAEAMGIVT